MKRDEAETIWNMISALYDLHPERSGEQAVVWVPALEEMDATIVMQIVNDWISGRGPERMPTLVSFAAEVRARKAVSVAPVHWDAPRDCDLCSDTGMVIVGTSKAGTDQMAPCPGCDRGKKLEFPGEKNGPWGSLGFWKGRPWRKGVEPDTVEITL